MTDLEAFVVAAYVFADEYPVPARCGRRPLVTDAELVALAVAQAAIGISSDRQFLGLIGRLLPGWFPHLPDQSLYNRRLRQLVELISIVQQHLARWLDSGGVRLSDGTLIGVANYPGCAQRTEFAGFARYGFAKPTHRYGWGVRLVLLTDERGLPLGYTVVPAKREGVRAARRPAHRHPGRGRDRRQGLLGPRLRRQARRRRHRAAHTGENPHRRQPRPRARARLEQARDRERLRQPQRPDAARAAPRQNTSRPRRPHRPAHPRPHTRHPAQQPQRPPRTRPRRLRRPLNHINPLVDRPLYTCHAQLGRHRRVRRRFGDRAPLLNRLV